MFIGRIKKVVTVEQTLRLFVKGLFEMKGIDKNLWIKKFIKSIVYSKEEIAVSFYYKSSSDKEQADISGGGWVGAAAARNGVSVSKENILLISRDKEDVEDWLPCSSGERTIDIIIPNTIHGCKKKDL